MEDVVVVIGAGQIGQAIARRVGIGKHVMLADRSEANANAAAEVMTNAGYQVSVATVDVSSRETVHALVGQATGIGEIVGLIQAAGVSPSQASPETILRVDLYGTAVVLEEFGKVIARGGSGVVISSQSGHRLPALSIEQNTALAMTPTEELLKLSFLQLDQGGIRCTRTSFRSAGTHCASWRKPCTGARAARESIRSARGSS